MGCMYIFTTKQRGKELCGGRENRSSVVSVLFAGRGQSLPLVKSTAWA